MGSVPYQPIVTRSPEEHSVVEIELEDLQEARRDPAIQALLKEAAAEGARVEREGRQRW
jgi:hypothetical protein